MVPELHRRAFPDVSPVSPENAVVLLWLEVAPPPALLGEGDEGESEIDVVIEGATWFWFIEAKYRSDIFGQTTMRADRDQVLRNIDVGSYYAGTRDFFFSLLIRDSVMSPRGVIAVVQY